MKKSKSLFQLTGFSENFYNTNKISLLAQPTKSKKSSERNKVTRNNTHILGTGSIASHWWYKSINQSWFSKFTAKIDDDTRNITLKSPGNFTKIVCRTVWLAERKAMQGSNYNLIGVV